MTLGGGQRLASLLVQEGLVSPERMAEAFQRQVIYGGTLDTILLEMDLLDETALCSALARAAALPVAPGRDEREADELHALAVPTWFSPTLAERYRTVAVARAGSTVRAYVTDPVDLPALDELGEILRVTIEPFIVPEYRFMATYSTVYRLPLPARFASLQAKLRQRAVEVEEEEEARRNKRESAALDLESARQQLEAAACRDAIFTALCRGARAELDLVLLFTVHKDGLVGRLGLSDRWLGPELLAQLSVALDRPSPFAAALHGAPYLGHLGDEPVTRRILTLCGRDVPTPGLLLPLTLRDRTVALLYGDRQGAAIDAAVLAELSTLASAATRAFQRLIVRSKGGAPGRAPRGNGEGTPTPVSEPVDEQLFDADPDVRLAAVQRAAASPASTLEALLQQLRAELGRPDLVRQRYAADALGALRDAQSVPDLIALIKHADTLLATAARRALLEIAKQDFGPSRWRWRSWWERHRHESRVEWMIEGLGHAEPAVRLSASKELHHLTDQHFGYHVDLPPPEREEAQRRWGEWWHLKQSQAIPNRSGPPR